MSLHELLVPAPQVQVRVGLLAEGVLAGQLDADVRELREAECIVAGQRHVEGEGAPDHPRPALVVGRHGPWGRADHQVVEHHRELRKRVQQPGGQVRVGGAGIEPDDVVPLGGVLPERVGRERCARPSARSDRAGRRSRAGGSRRCRRPRPAGPMWSSGWRGSGTRPIPLNRSG